MDFWKSEDELENFSFFKKSFLSLYITCTGCWFSEMAIDALNLFIGHDGIDSAFDETNWLQVFTWSGDWTNRTGTRFCCKYFRNGPIFSSIFKFKNFFRIIFFWINNFGIKKFVCALCKSKTSPFVLSSSVWSAFSVKMFQ